MKKYTVHGLRRFGNHFFIEWLLSHFNTGYHGNDVIGNHPYSHWSYINGNLTKGKTIDNPEVSILSYEDRMPPSDITPETIILLRDWYNVWSGRLVSNRLGCRGGECSNVYLEYCKLYETHPENFVLYNKLTTDPEYARSIEKRYGWGHIPIPTTLPKSGIGDGSSFTGKKLIQNDVNQRYKNIKQNYPNEWENIISNKDINAYMESIFGIKYNEL